MSISASYPNLRPTLLLDFANSGRLDPRVTFTRASTATYFDATGTLQSAAIDAPRFDYNPSTLAAQGLLIEEARTNSIRNNTMQGAVAGTPGTLPTNWLLNVGSLAVNVIGTGTQNGITYVDLQFVGTTNQTFASIRFEGNTQIAAANTQTWTNSFYVRRTSGSNTNITDIDNRIFYRDAGGATLQETGSSVVGLLSNTALNVSKSAYVYTCTAPTTAFVNSAIYLTTPNGVAIDITLRIGLPQLELGAFATSVIPTTTTALTRSADVASVNTLSPWYRADEGTVYAELTQTIESVNAMIPWEINDLTFDNRIFLAVDTPSGAGSRRLTSNMFAGGVSQAQMFSAALGTTFKAAFAWQTNNLAASQNGSAVQTDTSATIPSVSRLNLGSRSGVGNFFNGYLRRITYYPRRLSNAELQAITA